MRRFSRLGPSRLLGLAAGLAAGLLGGCTPKAAPWPATPPPVASGPMLLVTFESLRADFVSGLGGRPGSTPALDELILEARASGGWAGRAVAPSSWTSPVLASLLTGLGSWQHEVLHAGRALLDPDVPTLAERLGEQGWTTRAFAPGRRLSPKRSGLARGFTSTSPVRDDGKRQAVLHLRKLAAGRELVWVHLSRPDSAFERNRPKPIPEAQLAESYRAYVQWLDHELGLLLEALRASGQNDATLVAVVACTGQDLGDPGPRGVGAHLERSLIEVPLVVKLPAGARRPLAAPAEARVGTVRLAATLLEAAGGTATPAMAPSLFSELIPPVLSELYAAGGANQFSLVTGDRQLVRRIPLVAETAMPAEVQQSFQVTLPLSGRGEIEERLVRWTGPAGTTPENDPATLARLAAELERAWSSFLERERTPVAERWAARTR